MKNKQSYLAPEAELLEVKFEERFMVDSPTETEGMPGYNLDKGNSYTFGD